MGQNSLVHEKVLVLAPEADLVPPSRVRYHVLAVACSLALLAYIHRIGFAVGAPELKKDLALSDQDMGYLMAAFLVAYGLFEVPCGLLGDRFGARHLLTSLVVGWSLLTGCLALVVWLPPMVVLQ